MRHPSASHAQKMKSQCPLIKFISAVKRKIDPSITSNVALDSVYIARSGSVMTKFYGKRVTDALRTILIIHLNSGGINFELVNLDPRDLNT